MNLVTSVQVEATSHTTKQVEQVSRFGRSELAPLWSFQYDFVPVNDSLLGSCRIVVYQSISLENLSHWKTEVKTGLFWSDSSAQLYTILSVVRLNGSFTNLEQASHGIGSWRSLCRTFTKTAPTFTILRCSLNCQEAFSAFPEELLFEWTPYSHSVLSTLGKPQGRVENLRAEVLNVAL